MGHEIEDIWLDGRPVGEIGLARATAAAIGVPVVGRPLPATTRPARRRRTGTRHRHGP
ncbi:hypothetical protein [Streptomyces sp. NPDC051636]|uniref:hypothetical protein n=1 Tax=Streptomyces sp. NPDC051636 TaxID=3365663 RepID=UPI0037B87710